MRRGYTLLELLLALAVLLVVAGVAWPMLLRMYAGEPLQRSAEEVRQLLTASRLRAIDDGVVYEFRYEPDGPKYALLPQQSAGLAADESLTTPSGSAAESAALAEPLELPPGVRFGLSQAVSSGTTLSVLPDSRLSGGAWSDPILFHPDGSSIDATVDLVDDDGRSITITVRGLTGTADVSRIRRTEAR
jgi:prepilin-type N-terminal cleavage/methylation domain-containing protein